MKKFSLFAIAFVVALVMTACSDDSVSEAGTGSSIASIDGYIGMTINLPSSGGSSSRAGAVTGFSDGTTDEYEVNDVTVYLFAGTSVDNSTLAAVAKIDGSFTTVGTTTDQITSKSTVVFEVENLSTTTNYYPIVIINDNWLLTSKLTEGVSTMSDLLGMSVQTSATALTADGFFMSNSPYANHPGGEDSPMTHGDFAVTTAPQISLTKVYTTETEALANPATSIYVERAVGKVTLGNGLGTTTVGSITDENVLSVNLDGWLLDNTNKYTYPVRNVTEFTEDVWDYTSYNLEGDNYRFVDDEPIENSIYRTHFGMDPNYDIAYDANNFTADVTESSTFASVSTDANITTNPQYCLENTFDVAHMTEQNTTRAVIKTSLTVTDANGNETTSGDDFYIINNNENLLYSQIADVQSYMKLAIASELNKNWSTYISSDMPEGGVTTDFVSSVTLATMSTGGTDEVTAISIDDVTWQTNGNANLITAINNAYTVSYYKDGVVYYRVLIKHFGDDETPWDPTYEDVAADPSYGINTWADNGAGNYLGRYGIVRNTWYQISVDNLAKIGDPTIPDIPPTWDDDTDEYLGVTINILSWALRKQSATLE